MSIHSAREFAIGSIIQAHVPVLAGAPAFSIAAAHPASVFQAGSEIYAQGKKAGRLYMIEFGCVRIHRLLADGRRQISAFHFPGEIFGFEASGTHHFFAEAVGATGVHSISSSLQYDHEDGLLAFALKGLMRAQEHLVVLGRQSALERVAAFLVDMVERQGGLEDIELPMSRTDISDYLGLTFETVSRVFSKLKREGIICLPTARKVEVRKLKTLHNLLE